MGHLSEVSGIGGKRSEMRLEQGVTSLAALAARDPEQLAAALAVYGEQHREIAAELVAQARVQASGIPQRLGKGPALPELAGAPPAAAAAAPLLAAAAPPELLDAAELVAAELVAAGLVAAELAAGAGGAGAVSSNAMMASLLK